MDNHSKPKLSLVKSDKEDISSREGENWLANVPKGAVFLYRPYGSRRMLLSIRQVLFQWDNEVTLLGVNLRGEDEPQTEYVDTQLFSNLNEHVKTIYVAPPIEELQKEHDNDSDQVHPEGMG